MAWGGVHSESPIDGNGPVEAQSPAEQTPVQPAQSSADHETKRHVAKNILRRIPPKVWGVIVIVLVALLIFFFGFALPYLTTDHSTHYLSETDLETVVDIDELSTVEYVYHGIAEHHNKIEMLGHPIKDDVDYRVKYEAHVRATYALGDIRFKIDEANKTVTVYLPEAEVGKPQLIQSEFDYLPESAEASMKDVLSICREDASNDINKDEIRKEAVSSLQDTVKALTLPLLGDEYTIEYKILAEYDDGQAAADSVADGMTADESDNSAGGGNEGNGEGESNE